MPKQDSAVIRKGVEVSNMLNAILKYTPDGCSGDSVNDIIVDCRSNLPVCGDLNCNSFLATQIRDIIITLIDGRTTYEFAVKDNFAVEIISPIKSTPSGCSGNYKYTDKVIMPKYTATLNLCK